MSTNTTNKQIELPEYGQVIRDRREELHLSLDKLANKINHPIIYRDKIWRLETGKREPHHMSSLEIELLARGLDWTPSQLAKAIGITFIKNSDGLPHYDYSSSFSASKVVVNKYVFRNNEWMSTEIITPLLPKGSSPKDVFVIDVDDALFATVDIHNDLSIGMTLLFRFDTEPKEDDTVLVKNSEETGYTLATYPIQQDTVIAVRLDQQTSKTLESFEIVGVLSGLLQSTSSIKKR